MNYLETPQYPEHLNAIRLWALSVLNNTDFISKQLNLLDEARGTNSDYRLKDYEQILDSLETVFLKTRFTFAVLPMDEDRQLRLQGMSIPSDLKSLQVQAKLEEALAWEASNSEDDEGYYSKDCSKPY